MSKMHFHYFAITSPLSKVNMYSKNLLLGQVENDPTVKNYICKDRKKGYKDHFIKDEMRLIASKHFSFILIVI